MTQAQPTEIVSSLFRGLLSSQQAQSKFLRETAELRREIEGRWTVFSTEELRETLARLNAGAPASMTTIRLREEIRAALRFRDLHGEPV